MQEPKLKLRKHISNIVEAPTGATRANEKRAQHTPCLRKTAFSCFASRHPKGPKSKVQESKVRRPFTTTLYERMKPDLRLWTLDLGLLISDLGLWTLDLGSCTGSNRAPCGQEPSDCSDTWSGILRTGAWIEFFG